MELAVDLVGLHGLQGIGDDRIKFFSDQLRPGPVFQLGSRFQCKADSSPGVRDLGEPCEQVRHRIELQRHGAGLPTKFLWAIGARSGLEIGHRGGHEEKIMVGPVIPEFPVQVRCGLEPGGPDLRMRRRIDGARASEKGDWVSEIGRSTGDFNPNSP